VRYQARVLTIILAAVVAATVACGGSWNPKDSSAPAGISNQAAVKTASAAGPAECATYVRLVSQCIETRMPEAERADERQALDMFRRALAGGGPFAVQRTMDLESSCTKRIRRIIQGDQYGCYTEEAKKRRIQTACSLLTPGELSDMLGAPVEDGVQNANVCRYVFAGQARDPFTITVHLKDAGDEMVAARSAQSWMNGVAKNLPLPKDGDFVGGTTVDGLGDEAFITTVGGGWPRLVARQGDIGLELFGGSAKQLVAVARKALPRIEPEPSPERANARGER
jgi:hypothetical protein